MKINEVRTITIFAFTFFLLPFTLLYARGTITYIENFNDNSNGWWIGSNDQLKTDLKNGKYIIEKKAGKGQIIYLTTPLINEKNDFQIESAIRVAGGDYASGYGIIWGLKWVAGDGNNGFYVFCPHVNGEMYAYLVDDGKKVNAMAPIAKIPQVRKGNESVNHLVVRKTGNNIQGYMNGQALDGIPSRPFFGNLTGIYVDGKISLEVENLTVTASTPDIPKDLNVYVEGNFNSRFVWANPADEKNFKALIHYGSKMSIAKPLTSDEVNVTVMARSPRDISGSACGIYLQNDQGAVFKLERLKTQKGLIARFTVTMGGVDKGVKEVIIPDRDVSFRISRQKDAFLGEVSIDGKTQKVGSLKWPGLSPKHEAGVIVNYSDADLNVRGVWNYEFSNFLISASTKSATVQTSMRQPVPQKLEGHQGQPAVVNVAGTSWSCKDDDGQVHDLIFDRKGNFERPYHGSSVGAGTWQQSGNSVYLNVYNRTVEHWATVNGSQMQGKGRTSQGIEWTWLCTRKN